MLLCRLVSGGCFEDGMRKSFHFHAFLAFARTVVLLCVCVVLALLGKLDEGADCMIEMQVIWFAGCNLEQVARRHGITDVQEIQGLVGHLERLLEACARGQS